MKDAPPLPSDLICAANAIFDEAAIADRITSDIAMTKDPALARSMLVDLLKTANARGRAAIADALSQGPMAAHAATRSYCWLTDCLLRTVLSFATEQAHPLPNPTDSERIAVYAVGGYGRGEMAPQSDVDLLFLTPYKITAWAESVIETTLYVLWDLKLKIGHASRTVKECLRLATDEFRWITSAN